MRKPGYPLTAREEILIRDRALSGKSVTEIARELKRSHECVRQFGLRRGLEFENGNRALTDAEMLQIEELISENYSCAAVARAINRPAPTVARWARSLGLGFARPLRKDGTATVVLHFEAPEFYMLKLQADRRAMRVTEFCRTLLRYVLQPGSALADNLFDQSS